MKKKQTENRIDTTWLEKEPLIAEEFDLDADNKTVKGILALTKEAVFVCKEINGEKEILEYKLSDIEKIESRFDFGVYAYEAYLTDGTFVTLCHSTVEKSKELMDVTKAAQNGITNPESLDMFEKPERKPKDKKINKIHVTKRLLELVVPHKLGIIIVVAVYFLTMAISLVEPYINKMLVDDYIQNEAAHANPSKILVPFIITTSMLLVFNILSWGIGFLRNYIMMKMGIGAIVDVRKKLYDKVQKLSIGKIEEKTTGEIMRRLSGDANHVQHFVNTWVPNFFGQVITLIAVCFLLFFSARSLDIGFKLLLIFVLPLPITLFAIVSFHKKTRKIYGRQWEASSKTESILHDILSGIRVVKAYGTEERETVRYGEAAAYERDLSIKNEVLYAKLQPFVRFGLSLGSFMMLYFTGSKILEGSLTIGECTMFTSYISMVYGPLFWLANFPSHMARTLTSANRIFELLDEQENMGSLDTGVSRKIQGLLKFENVTFGYDATNQVLKNINLEIKPGEMIGLVGRSGVGKSTLTNLVMRLYDVESGKITVDGVDIRDYSQRCYRGQIGAVLQETVLFSMSLYDNLVYAKPGATREEVIACAKAAGVHDFAVKLPDGYNTRIGEKGYTLSGGERQRVAIARAILRDPRILILDEATSSLDTEMEKQIQEAIEFLIKDRTTIAIAHRLSTLRNASKIAVIDDGKIAEVGTHEELLEKRGIYYELVIAQRISNNVSKGGV